MQSLEQKALSELVTLTIAAYYRDEEVQVVIITSDLRVRTYDRTCDPCLCRVIRTLTEVGQDYRAAWWKSLRAMGVILRHGPR